MIAAVLTLCWAGSFTANDVWERVERLTFDGVADAERQTEILRAWELTESHEPAAERVLLEHVLSRLEGAMTTLPEPTGAWPWDARRSWLAATVLPEGPARARAIATALETLDPAERPSLAGPRLNLAWEVWLAAALDLRFEDALAIGRPVHADQRADWSGSSLALGLARAGFADEADRILTEQIARSAARAPLWSQKGIALWGARQDVRARRALGAAMLLGSVDASAVVARIDLAAGRRATARAGFRAALASDSPGPWARRGWALTQLGPRVRSRDRGW